MRYAYKSCDMRILRHATPPYDRSAYGIQEVEPDSENNLYVTVDSMLRAEDLAGQVTILIKPGRRRQASADELVITPG